MVKLVALWGRLEDERSQEDFVEEYLKDHIPLVDKVPHLSSVTLSQIPKGPYSRLAELYFPDVASLQAALSSPEGTALVDHSKVLVDRYGVSLTNFVAVEENR
ncbi:conserved hypothetical protein [Ferrithrix thermotolerans DSM 19514]|jgi:uncharacterized protein (TIGR02118 family)|uniref:EthD domain-containing protein n=1 Tax=Ferrithrix thermotolerans DSM 19514 TaxID=1121881 RepID=A0A1M4W2U0_9ACTN|nr:EthD family reductase [Ferrithrix thermotolerans]SHE75519.1 conserved hypothetical protein [Ferrithrix thermotolerans DSM 19514]